MIESAIYKGTIRHRRFSPVSHQFSYQLTMLMLDLDRIEQELNFPPFVGVKYPALGWFRRSDYVGNPQDNLKKHVLDKVEKNCGTRPDGKVLLLTHLRYWGFIMNPIAVFYCYNKDQILQSVALQVTNTPWKEKILYVVSMEGAGRNHQSRFSKSMHVSPFNPMEMEYLLRLQPPANKLFFHLENHVDGKPVTDATMTFQRHPFSIRRLVGLTLRQPSMTAKVGLGIYWQALRLWIKGMPFYNHPGTAESKPRTAQALSKPSE